jgi:hypothetical protein
MKVILRMAGDQLDDLIGHLLPGGSGTEEAAFLFVRPHVTPELTAFDVVEAAKLEPHDFDSQWDDYLELKDETRGRLIKQAHDLGASIVEMHSHPFPLPAAFSFADRKGLEETVPHMWWRLKNRPYLAIVVAPGSFDALVWLHDPRVPQRLDAILAGDRLLRPTNNSLEGWHG